MSSFAIRKLAKGLAKDTSSAQSVISDEDNFPFYDTVNLEQDPQDDQWVTLEFHMEHTETDTYCGTRMETGMIDFIFNGVSGRGDSMMTHCEDYVQAFMALWKDKVITDLQDKSLNRNDVLATTFTVVHAPEEFSHSTQRFYQVNIAVEYTHALK